MKKYNAYFINSLFLQKCNTSVVFESAGTNYWRNRVIKVARNLKGKVLNFAIAKTSDFARDLDSFGLKADSNDPVVTIKSDDGSKYAMKEKFRYLPCIFSNTFTRQPVPFFHQFNVLATALVSCQ